MRTPAKGWVCAAAIALVAQGGAMQAIPQEKPANAVGVFLRCTGQEDPLRALQAVKSLGFDTVQVSKLPDRF